MENIPFTSMDQVDRFFIEHFTNGKGVMLLKSPIPHFPQKFSNAFGLREHGAHAAQPVCTIRFIVTKRQGFFDVHDGVNAE